MRNCTLHQSASQLLADQNPTLPQQSPRNEENRKSSSQSKLQATSLRDKKNCPLPSQNTRRPDGKKQTSASSSEKSEATGGVAKTILTTSQRAPHSPSTLGRGWESDCAPCLRPVPKPCAKGLRPLFPQEVPAKVGARVWNFIKCGRNFPGGTMHIVTACPVQADAVGACRAQQWKSPATTARADNVTCGWGGPKFLRGN